MLAEGAISFIVDHVFGYLLDHLSEAAFDRLHPDPAKSAFQTALASTITRFEAQYPDWVASLFNADFLRIEAAPILAQFLLREGKPDPSELATLWANSLNLPHSEQRTARIRELEPVAADFLASFGRALKVDPVLNELNDSRAMEAIASNTHNALDQLDRILAYLEIFRRQAESDKSTPGTQQDYLHWMIEHTLYLDTRGTFQPQRQVQVQLDEIYVLLRAQREELLGSVDRRLSANEQAELEARLAAAGLSSDDLKDSYEQRLARRDAVMRARAEAKDQVMGLAEVVSTHEKAVILGDPGSGKTTLLRYLALKHAQALRDGLSEAAGNLGPTRFPIAVRVADYAEYGLPRGKSLSDFLVDDCLMHECPGKGLTDLFETQLARGNCLILLDGLDEIVSADDRRSVVRRIEEFVQRHDDVPNRFVVSSRIVGYRSTPLGEPFVHYTVQEMNNTQIHQFLDRWCYAMEAAETPDLSPEARGAVARREAENLMQAVIQVPGVRRLAANPLLLRILAQIHRTGAQLPQRRVELYRLAAETLERTWRSAQGVPESALVRSEYLIPLLSKLAYWLHKNKPTGLATEREVYEVLGEEWANLHDQTWDPDAPNVQIRGAITTFLLQVREHTGLFVERAPQQYGFMHLTFEEYYAARYLIARSRTRATLLRQHLHDPRWEEPILLGLGLVGLESRVEGQELLETAILAEGEDARTLGLPQGPYEDLLGWDFLFALRCLGDDLAIRPAVRGRFVERLAGELLEGNSPARFHRYWQVLEERLKPLGSSSTMAELRPLLTARLNGSSFLVRCWSWEITQGFLPGPSELCDALITAFQRESDLKLRAYIAQILGVCPLDSSELRIEVKKAQEVLIISSSIASTPAIDLSGQEEPAQSFSLKTWRKQWVAKQIAQLQDHDAVVRMHGAIGLEYEVSFPEAVEALLKAFVHDESAAVRSRAARGLGHIVQATPEIMSTLLLALQSDSSAFVRANATWSLGQIAANVPDVELALLSALRNDPDLAVRASAVCGLAKETASPEMIAALITGLPVSRNAYVRQRGAELLGEYGQAEESVIQVLLHGFLDRNGFVRIACSQGFVQLGQRFPAQAEEIERLLVQAIADPAFESVDTTKMDDDNVTKRPAYDYVYDALWQLVTNRRAVNNLI